MRHKITPFPSAGLVLPLLLCACTSIPDVHVRYYQPKTEVLVKVTRVLACGPASDRIHDALIIDEVTPHYVADTEFPYYFDLDAHDHRFSDVDAGFSFFADGRLQGINASAKGKGKETIEAVVGVVTGMRTSQTIVTPDTLARRPDPTSAACARIMGSPSSAPVDDLDLRSLNLTYEAVVSLPRSGSISNRKRTPHTLCNGTPGDGSTVKTNDPEENWIALALTPSLESKHDHCAIQSALGDLRVLVKQAATKDPHLPVIITGGSKTAKRIGAIQNDCRGGTCTSSEVVYITPPARRAIAIQRACADVDAKTCKRGDWSEVQRFNVPDSGGSDPLQIPVPPPRAFGGVAFDMTLGEAGGILTLRYQKGAAGDAIAGALAPVITLAGDSQDASEQDGTAEAEDTKLAALQQVLLSLKQSVDR